MILFQLITLYFMWFGGLNVSLKVIFSLFGVYLSYLIFRSLEVEKSE